MPFPFFIGLPLMVLAFLLFAGTLFSNGGLSSSKQFAVMGKLFRGELGKGPQLRMLASMLIALLAAPFFLAGIFILDKRKEEACELHCGASAYSLGPNSNRDPKDRKTWHLACICTDLEGSSIETPINGLIR